MRESCYSQTWLIRVHLMKNLGKFLLKEKKNHLDFCQAELNKKKVGN